MAFILCADPRILDPRYYAWLMDGDGIWHFLGWHVYRHSEWQWPPGAIGALRSGAAGGSIVYTDSIPLLGIALKPFSAALPPVFQYHGLWTLGCWSLQGLFGWRIASLWFSAAMTRALFSMLFCFSPVLLVYSHQGLMAHWLILAALWLNLRPRAEHGAIWWAVLMVSAVLAHAYIAAMVFVLLLSDVGQRRWISNGIDTGDALRWVGLSSVLALAAAWIAGYFVVGGSIVNHGFGTWSLNLLGLLLPYTPHPYTFLLPQHTLAAGQQEGFSYLGAGVLLLGTLLILLRAAPPTHGAKPSNTSSAPWQYRLPLLFAVTGLSLFALSNRITLGQHTLMSYPLPDPLLDVGNIFRASSRMVWPAYYLLYTLLGVAILRARPARLAIPLLACAVAVQAAECIRAGRAIEQHHYGQVAQQWHQPHDPAVWAAARKTAEHLVFVPEALGEEFHPLAVVAAPLRYTSNVFFSNRVDASARQRAADHTLQQWLSAALDEHSIYMLRKPALADFLLALRPGQLALATIQGLQLAAAPAVSASWPWAHQTPPGPPVERYAAALNRRTSFAEGAEGSRHIIDGFYPTEGWGVWSAGKSAALLFCLPARPDHAITLELEVAGHRYSSDVPVTILANGHPIPQTLVPGNGAPLLWQAEIKPEWFNNACLGITLQIPDPRAPAVGGVSTDTRRLGIGLIAATLRA